VEQIVNLMKQYQKPVIGVSLLTDEKDRTIYMADNEDYKGVFYTTPERAVKTLSKMFAYCKFTRK
jgi:16S rRNA C1402 (ribose-2'-O) methylase RsmI